MPEPSDAPGVAELFLSAGLSIEIAVLSRRLDALPGFPGTTLIAQEWGPPSGIIGLQWHLTLLADHPVARMTTLLVAPDARRRGLGRLLLKAASQAARVAGCDVLESFSDAGQPCFDSFLSSTGFVRSGQRFVRSLRKKS